LPLIRLNQRQKEAKTQAHRLATVVPYICLFYAIFAGVVTYRVGLWSLWSYLSRSSATMKIFATFIIVVGTFFTFCVIALFGWLARLVDKYVRKDPASVENRSRAVSAALYVVFFFVVSAISVVVGAPDMHLTIDQLPKTIWFAIPPGLAIVTLSQIDGWPKKVMCVFTSFVIYSIVSFVMFWFYAPSARHALDISKAMFAKNDVVVLYVISLISCLAAEISDIIRAVASWLLHKLPQLDPGRDPRRATRRGH
jgi:hypothetical protein